MAVFGLTSRNLAPTLRAKSNKSRSLGVGKCFGYPCSHGVLWGPWGLEFGDQIQIPNAVARRRQTQKLATASRICSECQQLILLNKIEFRQRCWLGEIIKT